MKFLKLTPTDNADISGYEDAIKYALNENDIENIAITGGYGTGKSSILNTYFKKHDKQSELMYINLGSYDHEVFNNEKDLEGNIIELEEKSTNITVHNIEEKIISQIMQQIDRKNVPHSLFRVKKNESWVSVIINTLMISIFIVLASYLLLPLSFNPIYILFEEINKVYHVLLSLIFILFASYIFLKLLSNQNVGSLLKRVSAYGMEAEFSNNNEYSYFDKYMNDIIYILLSSKKKIFIFEDLDRFDEPIIYEKLVEINTLLNKRTSNKETIKFIYLLRDDIFRSKERTKIFDFIIPIVPIIAYGNSYNKFTELLTQIKIDSKQNNVNIDFDSKFIQKILLYIDDMRLLKNIINEYFLYYRIIDFKDLDPTKLLGILIYKNIFPKDFYLFQYGKSYIDLIFSERDTLIRNEQKENNQKIEYLKNKIEEHKKTNLKNREEVEALYFPFLSYPNLRIGNEKVDPHTNKADIISEIKNNDYEIAFSELHYHNARKVNVKDDFDKIDKKITQEKYPFLFNNFDELYNELTELNYKNEIVKNNSMIELLELQDRTFFTKLCINNEQFNYLLNHEYLDLIIMLISEGFLDKQSLDYITDQTDNELDANERSFLRKLYDNKKDLEKIALKNPKNIIDKLEDGDIEQRKLQNIDITRYLIENKHPWLTDVIFICEIKENFSHIANVLDTLKTELKYNSGQNTKAKENINYLFSNILNNKNSKELLNEQVSIIGENTCLFVIECLEEDILLELLQMPGIKFYLENMAIRTDELKVIMNLVDQLANEKYSFKNIKLSAEQIKNKKLFEKLVDKNLVDITMENIFNVIEIFLNNINEREKIVSNLSILSQVNNENIKKYFIKDNLNKYVSVYLNFQKEHRVFKDRIQDVMTLLKSEGIEPHLLFEYLNDYKPLPRFPIIEEIPSKFLDKIIEKNIFEMTAENINFIVNNTKWHINDIVDRISEELDEIELDAIDESIIEELLNNILDLDSTKKENLLVHLQISYPNLFNYLKVEKIGKVSIELIYKLIISKAIPISFRKELFLSYITKLDLEQTLSCISELEFTTKLIRVLNRGRQYIDSTSENKSVLDYFETLGLLSKYKISDNDKYFVTGKNFSNNTEYGTIDLNKYI